MSLAGVLRINCEGKHWKQGDQLEATLFSWKDVLFSLVQITQTDLQKDMFHFIHIKSRSKGGLQDWLFQQLHDVIKETSCLDFVLFLC